MNTEALIAQIARQDFCRFLAACYYEPSDMFAEEGLFRSLRDVAACLDPGMAACAARLGDAFAATDLQTLLVDHTRLLIGPSRPLAVPYESFWRPHEPGDSADNAFPVETLYHECGFELDEEFRDLPDHIAVELEFLYTLLHRQRLALHAGERDEALATAEAIRRLLLDHLDQWAFAFAASLAEQAETDFYRALAELTVRYLQAEKLRLLSAQEQ